MQKGPVREIAGGTFCIRWFADHGQDVKLVRISRQGKIISLTKFIHLAIFSLPTKGG